MNDLKKKRNHHLHCTLIVLIKAFIVIFQNLILQMILYGKERGLELDLYKNLKVKNNNN